MKKLIQVFVFTAALTHSCLAQTSLTIIGTTHQATAHFNVDSLFNVLVKIKPDVILLELDTSLMDNDGNLKGVAITAKENEELASKKYKELNAKVIFRRFDIEDRNYYYASHKTFATEKRMWTAVDSLFHFKMLSDESMKTTSDYYQINGQLNTFYNDDIQELNSQSYSNVASQRQYKLYHDMLSVLANTPQLRPYYDFFKDDGDFWSRRNNAMVNNIVKYTQTFKGKTIVVLTGAFHKYLLMADLQPLQNKFSFKLNDLPK